MGRMPKYGPNTLAATGAELQAEYRARQAEKGIRNVQVKLEGDQYDALRKLWEETQPNHGLTWAQFLPKCLIRGSLFTANSGSGRKRKTLLEQSSPCNEKPRCQS